MGVGPDSASRSSEKLGMVEAEDTGATMSAHLFVFSSSVKCLYAPSTVSSNTRYRKEVRGIPGVILRLQPPRLRNRPHLHEMDLFLPIRLFAVTNPSSCGCHLDVSALEDLGVAERVIAIPSR